jgi:fatty acid desaturase
MDVRVDEAGHDRSAAYIKDGCVGAVAQRIAHDDVSRHDDDSAAADGIVDLARAAVERARWWERLLIAPNRVNYHLEHHLMMTVPHYKLPRFHTLLRERGVLDRACVTTGYFGVLRNAASKVSSAA